MPTFVKSVIEAFNEMTSLESPNDFFIASFIPGTEQLDLFAKGRGGLPKVKELLREHFSQDVAIAMFRLTAVDDRGKVKSFRTKLVHVVYMGPNTPVMKRAKVGPWNAAFKQPFTMNLNIQTDDIDGDLSEENLERSLRASGGAHQPTSFDFENKEGGSGSLESSLVLPSPKAASSPPSSPSNAPRSPSGIRSYVTAWNEHNKAFHARDVPNIKEQYSDEQCKLIYTNASTGSVIVSEGKEQIGETFEQIFAQFQGVYDIAKVEKTQPDTDHTSEGIVFCFWTTENGAVTGADTLCIVAGKIVVHTLVIHESASSPAGAEQQQIQQQHDDDLDSQTTTEFEDAGASNRADAGGDVPSQEEAASEPQGSQVASEDDFVEVDQPPLSVGEPSGEIESFGEQETGAEEPAEEDAPPQQQEQVVDEPGDEQQQQQQYQEADEAAVINEEEEQCEEEQQQQQVAENEGGNEEAPVEEGYTNEYDE